MGGKGLVHCSNYLTQKKGGHSIFFRGYKKTLLVITLVLVMGGCSDTAQESVEEPSILAPVSADFNRYFSELGRQVDVVIPHEFMPGERFDQEKMNENFDAVLEGIYEMKQRAEYSA